MSGEEFIILPNGKKIYLKDEYGKVNLDDMPKRSRMVTIFHSMDFLGSPETLNSAEVGSVFNTLKSYAMKDNNNELSEAELQEFIAEHYPEKEWGRVKPEEMLKFFELLQKKSDRALKSSNAKNVNIESSIEKNFPELSFLNLGLDNNVDTSKFTFEGLKKLYPEDKYEVVAEDELQYVTNEGGGLTTIWSVPPDDPGVIYETRIKSVQKIINKDSGAEVVVYSTFSDKGEVSHLDIELMDEASGKVFSVFGDGDGYYQINSPNYNNHISVREGQVQSVHLDGVSYNYEEGQVYEIFDGNILKLVEDGEIKKEIDLSERFKPIVERPHTPIFNELNSILSSDEVDSETLKSLLMTSVEEKSIGKNMDDYFNLTGRELIDDINNSSAVPEELKEELLKSISAPFVDSKYYDADKKIESSRVENKYYKSADEYSIQYNGPIITVFNKTTNKTTRLNMKALMPDFDSENLSKRRLLHSLQDLQNYSGEVLENIAIEIKEFNVLTKELAKQPDSKLIAAAFYSNDSITLRDLAHEKTLVHELGHGIDNKGDTSEFYSATTKFKELFDKYIAEYEASGHEIFDDQKNPYFDFFGTNMKKYPTYNVQEMFAACMEILMGYADKDEQARFIRKNMPAMIDAARELYLEIRQKPIEERRRQAEL